MEREQRSGAAASATSSGPQRSSIAQGVGKQTRVEGITPAHAPALRRTAERADDGETLNAAISVVAFTAAGKVIQSWAARAR